MNETVVPQVVRSYLEQLRTALREVPEEVSREIVDGIGEELAGLDAATAAARIEELGDPAFIAAEARAGVGPVAEPGPTPPVPNDSKNRAAVPVGSEAPVPVGDPRWYTIVTAALLLAGGIIVPLIGWVVGVAMLWSSRTWQLGDKLIGTFVLPGGTLSSLLLLSLPFRAVVTVGNSAESATPTFLDGAGIASGIVVVLLPFGAFVYLLWRAQKLRGASRS